MDEITFQDVLTHYGLKLKEIFDETETIKTQLKKAESVIDSGWSGSSADACKIKLEEINSEIYKTSAGISEALVKLNTVLTTASEDNIILI